MEIRAEMVGAVIAVDCVVGGRVEEGDQLLAIESMKMECPIVSPRAGTVARIDVAVGDLVEESQLLVVIGA